MIFVTKNNRFRFDFKDCRQQNGNVVFGHENARDILRKELNQFHDLCQIVFENPFSSIRLGGGCEGILGNDFEWRVCNESIRI